MCPTSIALTLSGKENFFFKDFGRRIFLKPSLTASLILCSVKLTPRISPERPISQNIAISAGAGTLFFDDIRATATAKSAAGSVILRPPVIFKNMSYE